MQQQAIGTHLLSLIADSVWHIKEGGTCRHQQSLVSAALHIRKPVCGSHAYAAKAMLQLSMYYMHILCKSALLIPNSRTDHMRIQVLQSMMVSIIIELGNSAQSWYHASMIKCGAHICLKV